MKTSPNAYSGYRYSIEIIGHTVWLYQRFTLSFRDIEDLLTERGIVVTYEYIHQWCQKFGLNYAKILRKKQHRLGDTWFMDEVFLNINGQRQYLCRAVDQDGEVVDILVQSPKSWHQPTRQQERQMQGFKSPGQA